MSVIILAYTGRIPQAFLDNWPIHEAVQILPPWPIRQSASTTSSALPVPLRRSWRCATLYTASVCLTIWGSSAPFMCRHAHIRLQGEMATAHVCGKLRRASCSVASTLED